MPWGPGSLLRGIGGSEEALIHMAARFRDRGWRVEIYGQPPPEEQGEHGGIAWRPFEDFDPARPGDVFVSWRGDEWVSLGSAHGQVHHWLHNHQDMPYSRQIAERVDHILVVSEHHARDRGFDALPAAKLVITRNGLDPDFLRPAGENTPHRAIYASCPARGLEIVLEMWPSIRRAVPNAQLDVYHGFTPIYEDMAVHFPALAWVRHQVTQRLEQLHDHGVTVHGMVGQDRLAEGFARAGVWLYPTDTDETSCITAMKALAMGCLPVTSGVGALPETLGQRDFGPRHPHRPISRSRWRRWRFQRTAIRLMRRGGEESYRRLRHEWSAWSRSRYDWSTIADQWEALFEQVAAEKGQTLGPRHTMHGGRDQAGRRTSPATMKSPASRPSMRAPAAGPAIVPEAIPENLSETLPAQGESS